MAIDYSATGLPTFLRGQYTETPQDTKEVFEPSNGRVITRERFTDPYFTLSGSISVSTAQRAIFKTFYHSDCANGSLEFLFPHPIDGTITCMFAGPYTMSEAGNDRWNISFSLWRLP